MQMKLKIKEIIARLWSQCFLRNTRVLVCFLDARFRFDGLVVYNSAEAGTDLSVLQRQLSELTFKSPGGMHALQ